MTLQVFPAAETLIRSFSIKTTEKFQTVKSAYDGANKVMQMNLRFPFRTVEIPYNKITDTGWPTLHNFFRARLGGYEPFWLYETKKRAHTDEYVGRGTGGTVTLDLHSKTTTNDASLILYSNAAPISKTFHSGTGEAAADQVEFSAALGALITSDYIGYLRTKMTLADELIEEWFREQHSKATLIFDEIQW